MSKLRKKIKNKNKQVIKETISKYSYSVFKNDKFIQLSEEFDNIIVPKNELVIMPNIIKTKSCNLKMNLEEIIKPFSPNIKPNSSILIIRYGGIGDIVTSLYGIAELKSKYNNNLIIGYMSATKNLSFLKCFPNLIDYAIGPIVKYEDFKKFEYLIYLDGVIENSLNSQTVPIHKLYANEMFVDIDKSTTRLINSIIPSTQLPRHGIGIQYKTNAIIRDYEIDKIIELINIISKLYNKDIHLLGPVDDYRCVNYIQSKTDCNIISNGCGFRSLNWKNTIELINNLELVIAPDSSMLHIAGICNVPMIGLFGPFPSKLRLQYYNNSVGIDGNTSCSPCFRHFPYTFCKINNSYGKCINSIEPELIISSVKEILGSPTK